MRAVLLQTSTSLNKAGTLTALSYPPDEIKGLMSSARSNLQLATVQLKEFESIEAISPEGEKLKTQAKTTYSTWMSDLEH